MMTAAVRGASIKFTAMDNGKHINSVKGQQIVAQMFGGVNYLYTLSLSLSLSLSLR
jgi:hypothetical protein